MIDVPFPTTDGRCLTIPRYTEPEPDLALLLHQLQLTLPSQPPPRIAAVSSEAVPTLKMLVQTFRTRLLKIKGFRLAYALNCESRAGLLSAGGGSGLGTLVGSMGCVRNWSFAERPGIIP